MTSLGRWFLQVAAVTSTAVRTIPQRLGASLSTTIGIALVVAVFVAVLSIGEGFRKTLRAAGSPDNAMVMRAGSDSEMMSALFGDSIEIIAQAPGIARGAVDGGHGRPWLSGGNGGVSEKTIEIKMALAQ